MAMNYEPEFYKALEPLLPVLASQPKPAVHDVEGRRASLMGLVSSLEANLPDAPSVERKDYLVEAEDGYKIKVIGFTKKDAASAPTAAILHFHGGGMIFGSAESFAKACQFEVSISGVPVYTVDYRVAPENPGTIPVDDCYAALLWLHAQAESLNIDPKRIAVKGESAGGGLAAGVALMARDKGLAPPLAKQILIYPMLDDRNLTPNPAIEPFAFWTNDDNITGWTALLGKKAGVADADVPIYCAPARAKSLAGLPPAYIDVGGLDIFRDEDMLYAQRLALENISVEFHLYPGIPHAFEVLAPQIATTRKAGENRTAAVMSL